jgi:single-strand DNA-binding protein
MSANSVTLIGNLVEDPELRFTPSGVAMAKVRFAVNRRYQRNNEWQEETSFFGGTLWRDAAENAAESLQKGMRVIVTGRLEQRTWETQEGDKRSVVEVAIDEMGPSLRWATATVTKTARSGGSGDWASGDNTPTTPEVPAAAPAGGGADDAPF